jgi:endonuclease/exonuclease/phosphatase family metal-dependent hydrolase
MPLMTTIRAVLRHPGAMVVLLALGCVHGAQPAAAPVPALRVMTYNIAAGHGDLERIASAIRAAGADVVALQEVDVHWDARSGFADQASVLGERLGMQARFAPIYDMPGTAEHPERRQFGVALLSRFPVIAFTNHEITRLSTQQNGAAPALMPGFLEARLDVHGTIIRVFNTHTDYRSDPSVRRRQVADMLAIVGDSARPTLLFGDLNAPPSAPELQPLFGRFRDAWRSSAGAGFTYPAENPAKRIDYVLASEDFLVRSARVVATEASDHRPVVADLALRRR